MDEPFGFIDEALSFVIPMIMPNLSLNETVTTKISHL